MTGHSGALKWGRRASSILDGGLVIIEGTCQNQPARMMPFSGDGWRRGAARARNWTSFAEPRSNPSTRERPSGRFSEAPAWHFRRLRQPRGWSNSRRGSRELEGSAKGNERTVRRGARSSSAARNATLGILFHRGLAVLRWGEPRFTRDVDVTLLCPFGREDEVSGPLLDLGYVGRISDAREFARRNRVLLLQSPNGIPIDVALAALPFEEGMVERSSLFELEAGSALRTCSAEDLIILKLFAFRPRDVLDAETIVVRQRAALD
jgi:hypothetical protein